MPAPSAPIFIYFGNTNIGSNMIFNIPPAETPNAAILAFPSERIKLERSVFNIVAVPPTIMTHFE